ncbi:hypothetical protein [Streptomyces sp. NPDC053427]|uniref:hypothetical protein n=1 Tax=Streptomyces sp. NPDC053427 TaxID=3365701 RepID=UPI0037D26A73
MPLSDEDWDLVTIWVREYLLNTTNPHTQLRLYGFPPDFIGSLPLTNVSATNARVLVHASRENIQGQLKLVETVATIDELAVLPDVEKAMTFLDRLRADRQLGVEIRADAKDNFRTSVFGDEVFIGRTALRETLREFVANPDKVVLLVDGDPGSGRSYTYTFLRHLGQQSGFRPARITLSRNSTADTLVRRLAGIVDASAARLSLNPTGLNDRLPSIDDAVHWAVGRATTLDERLWLVLDECDTLEPGSDVWDVIGQLALAIYEQASGDRAPRLVLLGYGPGMHQLPYDLKASQCRDTARIAGPCELHDFFDQYFRESPPACLGDGKLAEDTLTAMVDLAVDEVLHAAKKGGNGGDCYMRRVCAAAEGAVSAYRSL